MRLPFGAQSEMSWGAWLLCFGLAAVWVMGCGEVDGGEGGEVGMSTCQDINERFHFKVFIPPWKYVREYTCDDGDFRDCNHWTATGRHVFVVSDAPFVSFDSEIITSLTVEEEAGSASSLMQARIQEIGADEQAELIPASEEQDHRELETVGGYPVHDIAWRQEREFQGDTYDWYRRDSYVQVGSGRVFHLEFFSLFSLWLPEFDVLVESFELGPSPDGAQRCQCRDEHVSPPEPCR